MANTEELPGNKPLSERERLITYQDLHERNVEIQGFQDPPGPIEPAPDQKQATLKKSQLRLGVCKQALRISEHDMSSAQKFCAGLTSRIKTLTNDLEEAEDRMNWMKKEFSTPQGFDSKQLPEDERTEYLALQMKVNGLQSELDDACDLAQGQARVISLMSQEVKCVKSALHKLQTNLSEAKQTA